MQFNSIREIEMWMSRFEKESEGARSFLSKLTGYSNFNRSIPSAESAKVLKYRRKYYFKGGPAASTAKSAEAFSALDELAKTHSKNQIAKKIGIKSGIFYRRRKGLNERLANRILEVYEEMK